MSFSGLIADFSIVLSNTPPNVNGCSSLFIHPPAEGHLQGPQVLAIRSKAAVNIHVQVFVWTYVFSSLGKYQGAQLLDPMVRVCLVL